MKLVYISSLKFIDYDKYFRFFSQRKKENCLRNGTAAFDYRKMRNGLLERVPKLTRFVSSSFFLLNAGWGCLKIKPV
jgi:hypothetical protein